MTGKDNQDKVVEEGVENPSVNDVILGRGDTINRYVGSGTGFTAMSCSTSKRYLVWLLTTLLANR